MRSKRQGERLSKSNRMESVAKQSFKDECDLNNLVGKHLDRHAFDNVAPPVYGDATGPRDLQSALDLVESAQDAFLTLPANVRAAAANSEVRFLEMLSEEATARELYDLGLDIDGLPDLPEEPPVTPDPPIPQPPPGTEPV